MPEYSSIQSLAEAWKQRLSDCWCFIVVDEKYKEMSIGLKSYPVISPAVRRRALRSRGRGPLSGSNLSRQMVEGRYER